MGDPTGFPEYQRLRMERLRAEAVKNGGFVVGATVSHNGYDPAARGETAKIVAFHAYNGIHRMVELDRPLAGGRFHNPAHLSALSPPPRPDVGSTVALKCDPSGGTAKIISIVLRPSPGGLLAVALLDGPLARNTSYPLDHLYEISEPSLTWPEGFEVGATVLLKGTCIPQRIAKIVELREDGRVEVERSFVGRQELTIYHLAELALDTPKSHRGPLDESLQNGLAFLGITRELVLVLAPRETRALIALLQSSLVSKGEGLRD